MKRWTLLFFFTTVFGLCAGERIAGTKVSLNVPEGFTPAKQFPGYLMESTGASLMVSEIPGPFAEVSAGFSKQGLASRGMNLISRENVKLGADDAVLFKVSQSAHGTTFLKWMLAFGTAKETVLVVGTFPEDQSGLSEPLKKSVLSSEWLREAEVDLFEGLNFRVRGAGDLKIAQKVGHNILLTRDGVFPQKDKSAPMVVMGASLSEDSAIPAADQVAFARKRLLNVAILKNIEIASEKKLQVAGLDGVLLDGSGTDKQSGGATFVRQCLLFSDDGYYIFQGLVAAKDGEAYAPIFNQILQSFRLDP